MVKNHLLTQRLLASIYELLILIAIWMLVTWIFIRFFGDATVQPKRLILQCVLWSVTGVYFVICWSKSGQTIATQTWKIRLVNQQNEVLGLKQSIIRYFCASLLIGFFGLSFWWAMLDKERLFLHDRLLKTRFILAKTDA